MAQIAFIGLGNMGMPMASNLVTAGHTVRGFDLAESQREFLELLGGEVAITVADAVEGAEAVVTMLPTGQHVSAVLSGSGSGFDYAPKGTLFIDSSTTDVQTARTLSAEAKKRGFAMIDAPVSGGVAGATAGTLTFMVGGDQATLDRAEPFLQAMGSTIVLAGPAGAGQAAKICNNLMLGISMIGVSEAFALAAKLGLAPQSLFDISSKSSGQSWALTGYCPVPGPVPSSPANSEYEGGFSVELMLKDLTLARDAQQNAGSRSVLGPQARAAFDRLNDMGLGGKDFSVVAKALIEGSF